MTKKSNSKLAHWFATLSKSDLIIQVIKELSERDEQYKKKSIECRNWKARYLRLSGGKSE